MSQHTEPIPPSPTTILDLNGHVLCEVFKNMDEIDLSAIADVCLKFRWNALAVFSLWYKDRYFSACNMIEQSRDRSILRKFGPAINSLEVRFSKNPFMNSQRIMETIVQHCGETLIDLRLEDFTFTSDMISSLESLIKRSRILRTVHCQNDASEMLSLCTEFRTLSMVNVQNIYSKHLNFLIPLTILRLKSLNIIRCHSIQNGTIEKFLHANPQLEEVKIEWCDQITDRIFESVAKYAPQIEKFSMRSYDRLDFVKSAVHFKKLTALKWLEIYCGNELISPVINELAAAHVPLKCLILSEFIASRKLFNGISQLKQLETLQFFNGTNVHLHIRGIVQMVGCLTKLSDLRFFGFHNLTTTDFLKIIRCAPKLRHLQFFPNQTFGIDLYLEICELVRKREEMCRLEINLQSDVQSNLQSSSPFIPEELLEANSHLLKITF